MIEKFAFSWFFVMLIGGVCAFVFGFHAIPHAANNLADYFGLDHFAVAGGFGAIYALILFAPMIWVLVKG